MKKKLKYITLSLFCLTSVVEEFAAQAPAKTFYRDFSIAFINAAENGKFHKCSMLIRNRKQGEIENPQNDYYGETPLHWIAPFGSTGMLNDLIIAGENINIQDFAGVTPLQLAASMGQLENVKALIDVKANLDIQDNEGWTALDYAREHDHQEIVELLEEEQAMQRLKIKQALAGLYDPVSGISWGVDNGPGILIAQYVAG